MDHQPTPLAAVLLSERAVFVTDDLSAGEHLSLAWTLWRSGLGEAARIEIDLAARRLEACIAWRG